MTTRSDDGHAVTRFFESLNVPVTSLARELRKIVRTALPRASESIKWGMPIYDQHVPVCAIRPAKDYVALRFYQSGVDLDDPDGLLEGTGKKMRHVKIRSERDIKRQLFASWIKSAADRSR